MGLCPHLSLNIVNGPTLGVAVDAIILVKHLLDGTVHFVFYLNTVQCESIIEISSRVSFRQQTLSWLKHCPASQVRCDWF